MSLNCGCNVPCVYLKGESRVSEEPGQDRVVGITEKMQVTIFDCKQIKGSCVSANRLA